MSLKNMTLTSEATIGVTGGSALVFAEDGITIQNGLHLIVPADADYQTRRQVTAKYRPPTLDPKSGVYSKDKKSISYVRPVVLDNGKVVFNTIRIEREVHPSLHGDHALDLLKVAAQLAASSETAQFWATGSLS